MFEVFYWASFLGRNDIVNWIIKNGYSPLVKPHKSLLNAVFGTVKGNQYETLKLIMSYEYMTKNADEKNKCRENRDSNGNTVMHLAY
jgi:hypothetical protein